MSDNNQLMLEQLQMHTRKWLVTGGAGFIGSHVVEKLLHLGQRVKVLDNYFSSTPENLKQVRNSVGMDKSSLLEFSLGDIRDPEDCKKALCGVDYVIHLAALGSVPLSVEKPMLCHDINVTGTLNLMLMAQTTKIKRFVYASSSAVYGNDPLPKKRENVLGQRISPYAASKYISEIYAETLYHAYGFQSVGLRFFNVFGPRQNPKGAYAAVIPCWIDAMSKNESVYINGDGSSMRDFCFIKDVVQAILLASTSNDHAVLGKSLNVGLGQAMCLNELFNSLRSSVHKLTGRNIPDVVYRDFRAGDILYSCADITQVRQILGFTPEYTVAAGLDETVATLIHATPCEKM